MSLRTYDGLVAGIRNWLHRVGETQLEERIPEFLELAQDKVNQELFLLSNEKSMTFQLTDQTYILPDDYRGIRVCAVPGNPVQRLEYVAPASFWGRWFSSEGGKPKFYTIEGDPSGGGYSLSFGPWRTEDDAGNPQNVSIFYWAKFPELTISNQTNWLTSNASGLLLYAALVEGSQYFSRPVADTVKWAQNYDSQIESLNSMDSRQRMSRDGASMQPWGVSVDG